MAMHVDSRNLSPSGPAKPFSNEVSKPSRRPPRSRDSAKELSVRMRFGDEGASPVSPPTTGTGWLMGQISENGTGSRRVGASELSVSSLSFSSPAGGSGSSPAACGSVTGSSARVSASRRSMSSAGCPLALMSSGNVPASVMSSPSGAGAEIGTLSVTSRFSPAFSSMGALKVPATSNTDSGSARIVRASAEEASAPARCGRSATLLISALEVLCTCTLMVSVECRAATCGVKLVIESRRGPCSPTRLVPLPHNCSSCAKAGGATVVGKHSMSAAVAAVTLRTTFLGNCNLNMRNHLGVCRPARFSARARSGSRLCARRASLRSSA